MIDSPDYSKYSLEDLMDAYGHINKEAYPERVKMIEIEIKKRKEGIFTPTNSLHENIQFKQLLRLEMDNGLIKDNPNYESIESAVLSLEHLNRNYAELIVNDFKYLKAIKGFNGRYTLIYQDGTDDIYQSKLKILSKEFIIKIFIEYAKVNGNWKKMIHWEVLYYNPLSENYIIKKLKFIFPYILSVLSISVNLNRKFLTKEFAALPISLNKMLFVLLLLSFYLYRDRILNIHKICRIERIDTIGVIIFIITSIFFVLNFNI